MKKIGILGSTGSIGTQALEIIDRNRDLYEVSILSCRSNVELLCEQIDRFSPEAVVVSDSIQAEYLIKNYEKSSKKFEIFYGEEGLDVVAAEVDYDILLNSLVGISGLSPTYKAISAGKNIALANKETLVAGGSIVMKKVKETGSQILPVDSEHSAIFQCLQGNNNQKLRRILLTASGGPFRGKNFEELKYMTPEDALKHPNWSMGNKISIDSATMMNKGLEVIEAKWLFNVDIDSIQVLVHPQSIVHSGVEFIDGSVIMQLGVPDMRTPIAYAFSYPERKENRYEYLDFFNDASKLTFEKPDMDVFRCLKLAYQASEKGGSYPVVLNGANEVLVDLFLKGKIGFTDIQTLLEEILNRHVPEYEMTLEKILEVDKEARRSVYDIVNENK